MAFKGSINCRNDNINFIRVDARTEAKIERQDGAIATITFVDANGVPVDVPAGMQLVFQCTQTPALRIGQSFIITWREDYSMMRGGVEVFSLDHQKQQAIGGPRDLETYVVQA